MEQTPATKYFIYARKSSEGDERQVQSIDSQINELTELNNRIGKKIIGVPRVESHSAKNPNEREVFNKLLDDIDFGLANGLLVWGLDRLSRNAVDTGRLIHLMDRGRLLEIITPTQTFQNTPNDKFMITIVAGQAKLENDNKGLSVKRGLKTKAERGWLPGPAPVGYMNDPRAEKGNKTILEDPKRFEKMKKIWQLMLTGQYNPSKIVEIAINEMELTVPSRGKKPETKLSRSGIYRILTNPFYYGIFEYPAGSGNWIQGKHEPMITKYEFLAVQDILSGRSKPRPQKHIFTYAGLFWCGNCGATITADFKTKIQKNGNVHNYTYCRCTKQKRGIKCLEKYIEIGELEKQILNNLKRIYVMPEVLELAMMELENKNKKDRSFMEKLIREKEAEFNRLDNDFSNLLSLYASKGNSDYSLITPEEFKKRKSRNKSDMEKMELEIGKLKTRLPTNQDTITSYNLAQKAHDKFKNGTPEEKRRILIDVYDRLIIKDQKIIFTLKPIFQNIKDLKRKN